MTSQQAHVTPATGGASPQRITWAIRQAGIPPQPRLLLIHLADTWPAHGPAPAIDAAAVGSLLGLTAEAVLEGYAILYQSGAVQALVAINAADGGRL